MERKQAPTLKEQRKSNPGKTFEMLDEDVCILVKGRGGGGEHALRSPQGLWRDAPDRIGQWQGRGWRCPPVPVQLEVGSVQQARTSPNNCPKILTSNH